VFGVTMDSVVSGESGMAVPVGNTLMTKPTGPRKQEAPQPYAGGAAQAVQAVPEVNVATLPRVLFEVNGDDNYPPDAKALGIEGNVKASITINEKGLVVAVRILERAGHGFDEMATQALRRFRFSPALTSDGRPVPYRFTYDYRFAIGD
jgi:protein TonB